MSESLNGKVPSSACRGSGNRRNFQFKANQSQERGLIESLPVLKTKWKTSLPFIQNGRPNASEIYRLE
jgi:hypothetical protein